MSFLQNRLDNLLKYVAILSIRLYQIFGRPLFRRTCIFELTCSNYALAMLKKHGGKQGIQLTRHRLSECRGNYSLRLNSKGEVEMITSSGKVIPELKINPVIRDRLKKFKFAVPNNSNQD
ncbi:MAG: membrane protein insertion efficiency factor YidD [Cyanobacteria bacterium SBC]|nr:membrane protein insertion efficiency factor YidD [Cyanobacteria bacterium SBC]